MNRELYDEAIRSNILSRKLIEQLMESMNYSSISFINWTVEVLKIIKTRLERGDKITDEVSGITYDIKSFRNFVSTNFSSYITSQVFDAPDKAEKVYFSLEATEDGHAYNMVMANSSKDKTYKWISSLSERFSLVLDEDDLIIGYQFVNLGKMTDFIKKGDDPNTAWEKAAGQYGKKRTAH